MLKYSNKALILCALPLLPVALATSRFISWHDYLIRLFRKKNGPLNLFGHFFSTIQFIVFSFYLIKAAYLRRRNEEMKRKLSHNVTDEEEEEQEDAQFLATIRLILGGLLLPTMAISIDRFILFRFNIFPKSTLVRTIFVSFNYHFNILKHCLLLLKNKNHI
jgi:hypothetical protein